MKMRISDFRQKVNSVFKNLYDEPDKRVIIEKSGMTVGAVIGRSDLHRLMQLDRETEDFFNSTKQGREAFKAISEDEIMENAVKAVREVRQEIQEERNTRNTKG